jgi:hypothetical protein
VHLLLESGFCKGWYLQKVCYGIIQVSNSKNTNAVKCVKNEY